MLKKEIKQLHKEFGIHFKNSPDELKFLETFIDELIESRDRQFTKGYQRDLIRVNKSINKSCEEKVKEAIKCKTEAIRKLLIAYAFTEKPVSITKLFKQIDKL